ncbi:MAG: hypothetical protein P4L27_05405 [Ignavibacteriaceae bacterium]|nr:hypothetical protein [Ignavibacteriaceae bacterium]
MSIRGLYVDDNIGVAKIRIDLAYQEYQIRLDHITNLKKMEDDLKESPVLYACVILEAKCRYEQDDHISSIDHILKSLVFLKTNYADIPYYILTSDIEGYRLVEKCWGKDRLFYKSDTEIERLFETIKSLSSDKTKIRRSYSKVFEVIDYHKLSADTETQLINLLANQDRVDKIKQNLKDTRWILESIFQTIIKQKKDIIPKKYLDKNSNKGFWGIHTNLRGNPEKEKFIAQTDLIGNPEKKKEIYIPQTEVFYSGPIQELVEMIHPVTSDHGVHPNITDYKPTIYTVKSCVNALLECILWFDRIMRKK